MASECLSGKEEEEVEAQRLIANTCYLGSYSPLGTQSRGEAKETALGFKALAVDVEGQHLGHS